MTKSATKPARDPDQIRKEKEREEQLHEKAVEQSFPASDPPATSQPGSGITGPEVLDEKKKPR